MDKFIYIAIFFLFSIFPFIGLLILDSTDLLDDKQIIKANALFLMIFLFFIILALKKIIKNKFKWNFIEKFSDSSIKNTLKSIRFIIIVVFIINFLLGGYYIIMGGSRGDLRVSLGGFGWLYTFNNLYCVPSLLTLATTLFTYFSKNKKNIRIIFFQIIILSLIIGFMTGYKATFLFIFFGSLIQVSQNLKLKHLFLIVFTVLILVTITGMMQRESSVIESYNYNIYRATELATKGTLGSWDMFPNGAQKPSKTLYMILGENLSSKLLRIDKHSYDFLEYSLAKTITYNYYPNKDGAIEGTVNLTVNSFGESIFWFGHKYYAIYAIVLGLFMYFLTIKIFKTRNKEMLKQNILYTTYFCSVVIPWVNSASLANLFGVTTLFYLVLTYLMIKKLISKLYKYDNNKKIN